MSKSTTNPDISIIVSAYNNAKELPTCLDALLEQTYKNIEIICINDASTDDTGHILDDYTRRDSRLKVITNEKNIGLSRSRNNGINQAKAPYIMFCDGDDYYDTTMCEKMLNKMRKTDLEVGLVISEIRVVYHAHPEMRMSDDYYYHLHFAGYQPVTERVMLETDFSPTNKMFRRDLLDKYDLRFPEGLHYEDAYFCAAYLFICKSVYYLNEQLYTYVRRPGSIMSNTWSKDSKNDTSLDHLYIAFQLFDFMKEHNLLDEYNTMFWQHFIGFEHLTIHYSKSKENTKKARELVYNFIREHQESFTNTPIEIQNAVNQMTAKRFAPSKTRLKQLILKLMPTYRLQIQNVIRLRALQQKNKQLLETLEKR